MHLLPQPTPVTSAASLKVCLRAVLSAACLSLGVQLGLMGQGWAQAAPPVAPEASPELTTRQLELRSVEDTLRESDAQRRKLEADVEGLRSDRARLNAALIETAARAKATEARMSQAERKLSQAKDSETAIRQSLESRRAVVGEVLAALQRLGRFRPPAVLALPEDMLEAVRASMLLGAVVPELRSETESLAKDLQELVRLRAMVSEERSVLDREIKALATEGERVQLLVSARQTSIVQAEKSLESQRIRERDLSRQSVDLKDLITRMENEIQAAGQGAAASRQADELRRKAGPDRLALAPFKDPSRLAPAIDFVNAKGLLPLPVSGTISKAFGAPDGFGAVEKGISIATRAGAIVSSPADGWVAFAGPWRTYGQLLIINTGSGYYVVLAGMQQINVELGQFVLAGEPVALMGEGSVKAASAVAIGAAQPILYVEFRKDGAAIDPGPWWAKPELEKVRG